MQPPFDDRRTADARPEYTPPIFVAVLEYDIVDRMALERAIAHAPDMHLCWAVGTREQARQRLAEMMGALDAGELDVLLVGLPLPDGSALDVIAECRARFPFTATMVSTDLEDAPSVLRAIGQGAMGYLLKSLSAADALDEIRSLHAGGSALHPAVARALLGREALSMGTSLQEAGLPTEIAHSAREAQLLQSVAQGHTLEAVAHDMGVTLPVARAMVRRIYAKLQVGVRVQAMQAAFARGD